MTVDDIFNGISGCGDTSCIVEKKPHGENRMYTNGGCRCHNDHRKMQNVLIRVNRVLAANKRKLS